MSHKFTPVPGLLAAYADMCAIHQQIGQPAAVDNPLDIDRDGVIAYADMHATYPEIGKLPRA